MFPLSAQQGSETSGVKIRIIYYNWSQDTGTGQENQDQELHRDGYRDTEIGPELILEYGTLNAHESNKARTYLASFLTDPV